MKGAHVSVDAHIVPCLKDRGCVFVALHVDVYVKGAHGLFMFHVDAHIVPCLKDRGRVFCCSTRRCITITGC